METINSYTRQTKQPTDEVRSLVQDRHRREVWQQIILPCALFIILFIAAGSFVALSVAANISLWASISIILLIIPLSFFLITILLIVVVLTYGVISILSWLPQPATEAHRFFSLVVDRSRRISDRSVAPILIFASWRAGLASVWRALGRAFSRPF